MSRSEALRIGVAGYLLKRSVAEELPLAIRAASRKEIYLTPSVSGPLIEGLINGETVGAPEQGFDALTSRERQVLQLLAEGKTQNEIARALQLSIRSVKKYCADLTAKLNIRDTAGLVRIAVQHQLVSLDE